MSNPDECKIRVNVDKTMPELYERLAKLKRPARDAIYLMRLGVFLERHLLNNGNSAGMLSGIPPFLPAAIQRPGKTVDRLDEEEPAQQDAATNLPLDRFANLPAISVDQFFQ